MRAHNHVFQKLQWYFIQHHPCCYNIYQNISVPSKITIGARSGKSNTSLPTGWPFFIADVTCVTAVWRVPGEHAQPHQDFAALDGNLYPSRHKLASASIIHEKIIFNTKNIFEKNNYGFSFYRIFDFSIKLFFIVFFCFILF